MTLILASASSARRHMLEAAGLTFEVVPSTANEDSAKATYRAGGMKPRAQAEALAELKALSISSERDGLVIGADQMLAVDDRVMDKPRDIAEARQHLRTLRGKTHELLTAVVVSRGKDIIWRHLDVPRLTMCAFSDAFLEHYMSRAGESTLRSVGAYQLEGLGAQLFERVEGDYFSVLGLPLLPLLGFLREQGIVAR
ncbi:MAG: nucleoside triphosphate pyrophosphatase [Terricaulis sp.]